MFKDELQIFYHIQNLIVLIIIRGTETKRTDNMVYLLIIMASTRAKMFSSTKYVATTKWNLSYYKLFPPINELLMDRCFAVHLVRKERVAPISRWCVVQPEKIELANYKR